MLRQRRTPDFVHGLPNAQAALVYAARAHAGQRRRPDGAPFIEHPIEVASLLYYAGEPDHLIAAGLLHDVLEKTGALATDVRKRFGGRIAGLVLAVSDDERIADYAERKLALREQAARAGDEALLLLAADKISKVRELRREPSPPPIAPARRLAHYRGCLRLLETLLPDAPLVTQLRVELEALPGAVGAPPLTAASLRPRRALLSPY